MFVCLFMDEELSRPYQKLQSVEEQLERDGLLDYYVRLYKAKYKAEPIFPVTAVTQTQIKDLQRIMKGKAYEALTAYFQISDKWFEQQHYSLECLLKNLSKVNVKIQRNTNQVSLKGKIKVPFHCDSCWKPFDLVCEPTFKFCDEFVQCEDCKTAKNPPKRVTKEERRKTILKLGSTFPEVPKVPEVSVDS